MYVMYYVPAGALNCIIKRRLYRGKISFLPCETESTEQSTTQTNDSTDPQEQADKPQQELSDKPQQEQSERVSSSEEGKVSVTIDLEEEKQEVKEEGTSADTTEQTGTGEQQADPKSPATGIQVEVQTTPNSQSEQSADSALDDKQQTQENFSQFGPKADLLPSLSGPVPENWETIERDFLAITPLMIPHMAHNFFGDPAFAIGAGKIRVIIVDGQISRLGMFGLLTKADTGEHLEVNGVLRKDVMAFRLEPHTSPGMLTVDGEEVYYGPLQCQIHPTLARVMCRKRRV